MADYSFKSPAEDAQGNMAFEHTRPDSLLVKSKGGCLSGATIKVRVTLAQAQADALLELESPRMAAYCREACKDWEGAWILGGQALTRINNKVQKSDGATLKKHQDKAIGVNWEKKIERSPAPAGPAGSMAGERPKAVSGKATLAADMAVTGYRQVTLARLLIAAAGVPALAACGGNCTARLTLINASGLAIASGTLRFPGTAETLPLGNLSSPDTSDYRFRDVGEGAYAIDIRFVDGSSRRDTSLGYLTHGMEFRDTLVVRPFGAPAPLALKQTPGGCREAPRLKTVIREILKKVF